MEGAVVSDVACGTRKFGAASAGPAYAAAIPAIMPPAADPVSAQNAAVLSVLHSEHAAVVGEATGELGRSGVGVGESDVSCAVGDGAAAASNAASGGLF
ncbi:hypothetical protein B8W66_11730 [Mycobacterium decipiens]|uniref:PE domain-containing protein n=1 Tax=Mycobacterium decipiens TaxID=1430326 RepID=A0A1X2LV07_9MYCO|nr:hypothetical protein B8W66_11730 [Mycobacterium decipiens]